MIDFQCASVGKYPHQTVPEIGNHLNTDAGGSGPVTEKHLEPGDNCRLIMLLLTKVATPLYPAEIFASKCLL